MLTSLARRAFSKTRPVFAQASVASRAFSSGASPQISPYFSPSHSISEVLASFGKSEDLKLGESVSVGGRIIGRRKASKSLLFLDIESGGETLQVMINSSNLTPSDSMNAEDYFKDKVAAPCKRGVILGVKGVTGLTDAGERTLVASEINILADCQKNLPMMNWTHAKTLKDTEKRFRERHLDLIVNSEFKQFFYKRAKIISFLRRFLEKRDFLEVETPVLNAQAGGALARPFLTESNELKQNLELRIAPELYLKKLIVGGFDRVYEIGKVFRNEGVDQSHNPEFTSLEFYMAYADYRDLMTLTEQLLKELATEILGAEKATIPLFDIDAKIKTKGIEASKDPQALPTTDIDFSGSFQKFDVMTEIGVDPGLLTDMTGLHAECEKRLRESVLPVLDASKEKDDRNKAKELDRTMHKLNAKQMIDTLIENLIETRCDRPSFIMNHPVLMSPLAKTHAQGRFASYRRGDIVPSDVPKESLIDGQFGFEISERFELFVKGMEVINAYSEQNNTEMQKKAFETQTFMGDGDHKGEDVELHRNDDDFLEALSYGMPPTAGWGCGIDRLAMLFCGAKSIREVILFPMTRSALAGKKKKKSKKA